MLRRPVVEQTQLFQPTSGAEFDETGTYRYLLWRNFAAPGEALRICLFIMLNPSTADASLNDATIRRCIGFARRLGYNALQVANLFGLRSTDPKALYGHPAPVGPRNDDFLSAAIGRAGIIVCAWGTNGGLHQRDYQVRKLIHAAGKVPHCLGVTKDGHPKHPVRLANNTELVAL